AAPSAAASPRTINSSTPGREARLGAREEQPLRAAPPPRVSGEARPPPTSAAAPATPSVTGTIHVKQPLVKVEFGTGRLPSGTSGPSNYFGVEWNKDGDHLFTGYVTVSIPPPHKEGNVERPFKFWFIEFSEDPKKHFVLTELKPVQGNDFYAMLRDEYA